MAFNGGWKADRNENYDKFMEQMGTCVCVCVSFILNVCYLYIVCVFVVCYTMVGPIAWLVCLTLALSSELPSVQFNFPSWILSF
ncbi:hypothetical protein NHX12_013653 [Muraenolepis orangiensis]|uniref:Uncharacterized protein n=1 Tax=Muraenolepis orangiensis TaxID=630683 RepID=A0A9Q0DDC5_9TELE|nr:hypothetical protein NHX12_013653 [Muraenolepis orangiensis]